jgi:hypothetical protein
MKKLSLKNRLKLYFKGWCQDGEIIHSKEYGSYPATVDFTAGMTLYPGQSAIMTIGKLNEILKDNADGK